MSKIDWFFTCSACEEELVSSARAKEIPVTIEGKRFTVHIAGMSKNWHEDLPTFGEVICVLCATKCKGPNNLS